MKTKIKTKEADVMRAVRDYLDAKGYLYIRNQSGATKIGERFVRFGSKGSPDYLVFAHGQTFALEVKASNGKMSPEQIEWKARFGKSGAGTYYVHD